VGPEHPARFIRDLVDSLDLPSRGFQVRATEAGRPPEARRQDASAQWQRSSGTPTPNFYQQNAEVCDGFWVSAPYIFYKIILELNPNRL
jgi:hypothetical protein